MRTWANSVKYDGNLYVAAGLTSKRLTPTRKQSLYWAVTRMQSRDVYTYIIPAQKGCGITTKERFAGVGFLQDSVIFGMGER